MLQTILAVTSAEGFVKDKLSKHETDFSKQVFLSALVKNTVMYT